MDVDGVITVNDGSGTICQAKLKRLQSVVQQTQSVICISSNWRLFPQLKHRLTMVLQQYGMRVIGATPDHGERTHGRAVRAPSPRSRPLPLLPFLHPFLHSPPVPLIWTGYGITLQPRLQEPDYHTVNKLTPSSPRLPQVRPEEIVAWIRGVAWGAYRGLVCGGRQTAALGEWRQVSGGPLRASGREARDNRARGGAPLFPPGDRARRV